MWTKFLTLQDQVMSEVSRNDVTRLPSQIVWFEQLLHHEEKRNKLYETAATDSESSVSSC